MCGSDTLTTVVSSTTMNVPRHHRDGDEPRVDVAAAGAPVDRVRVPVAAAVSG